MINYWAIFFFKLMYCVFNGPQMALVMDILISYFKKTKGEEYILLGTSFVGLFKYVETSIGVYIAGYIVGEQTTRIEALYIELIIQYFIIASFASVSAINLIMRWKGINLESRITPKQKRDLEQSFMIMA